MKKKETNIQQKETLNLEDKFIQVLISIKIPKQK